MTPTGQSVAARNAGKLVLAESPEHGLDGRTQLDACDELADAPVAAHAESQVVPDVRSVEVRQVRIGELGRVAVGGAPGQQYAFAGGDVLATEYGVGAGVAPKVV